MTRLIITTILAALIMPLSADTRQDIMQLSREKRKLSRDVGRLFQAKKLGENKEYQAASQKAFMASRAFTKARKEHPKLKELYAKSDALQKKMIKARIDSDKEAGKKAQSEFTQVRIEIEKVARDIPELKEIQNQATKANQEMQEKEKELLAATPEGKVLIGKINALDAKIAALRKEMRMNK